MTTTEQKNEIIRRAKVIIEALNLPEGGGVAMDGELGSWFRWRCFTEHAYLSSGENPYWYPFSTDDGTFPPPGFRKPIEHWELPDMALAAWPGLWRESWIDRDTKEKP